MADELRPVAFAEKVFERVVVEKEPCVIRGGVPAGKLTANYYLDPIPFQNRDDRREEFEEREP